MENLTMTEFNALNVYPDSIRTEEITTVVSIAQQVNQYYPAEPVFDCSKTNERIYYNSCRVLLKHDEVQIFLKYESYRKKYDFFCRDRYKHISYSLRKEAQEKVSKPNEVGVLTEKKVKDWVNYYVELHSMLRAADARGIKMEQDFKRTLEGLPVEWWNKEKKKGEIEINGIVFAFEIQEGFIRQEIKMDRLKTDNVETFLQLSDNKYKPKK